MRIRIPTISPRDYQVPFLKAFDAGTQYSVISWHRRAGKDVTSFNALMKRAKLAGLGEEKQDIIIEVVNYNDVKKTSTPPKKQRRKPKLTTTK